MAKEKVENTPSANNNGGFSLQSIDAFFKKNKKAVLIGVIAIAVVAGGLFYYQKYVKAPRELEAAEKMFKAEFYFGLDSFNLALNGRQDLPGLEGFMGFNEICETYGSTESGNLAHYYAGVCNLQLGKYQEAIDHLKEFSSNDVLIGPIALGCMGDAYRELNDSENAVKYYEKAASKNNNSFTSPIYLKKAALTYEEDLKNYDKALDIYKKIQKEYGNTNEGRDIAKYIARLETMTGK